MVNVYLYIKSYPILSSLWISPVTFDAEYHLMYFNIKLITRGRYQFLMHCLIRAEGNWDHKSYVIAHICWCGRHGDPLSWNPSGIGPVSLARENEAGGSWGQEVHILHVNI